jgi:hypothetical protein
LSNRIKSTGSLSKLSVSFANMVVYNQELIAANIFLVHGINGFFCIRNFFEANVAIILEVSFIISLNRGRNDIAKLSKQALKLFVSSSIRKVFDKKIV